MQAEVGRLPLPLRPPQAGVAVVRLQRSQRQGGGSPKGRRQRTQEQSCSCRPLRGRSLIEHLTRLSESSSETGKGSASDQSESPVIPSTPRFCAACRRVLDGNESIGAFEGAPVHGAAARSSFSNALRQRCRRFAVAVDSGSRLG